MGEAFKINREMLDGVERYRQQLLESTDRRIWKLKGDLRSQEEWRAWCANALPVEIYAREQAEIEANSKAEEEALVRERHREYEKQSRRNSRILIFFAVAASLIILFGFEWYASTSYGNFCYRIGHHIVSTLIGVPIVGGIIWASMWLTGELRSK